MTTTTQKNEPSKGQVWATVLAVIGLGILALTNPTETDMRTKISSDGWAPVGFERTNLVIFNWVKINGFTGAKATYIGILGGIFKTPWSDK